MRNPCCELLPRPRTVKMVSVVVNGKFYTMHVEVNSPQDEMIMRAEFRAERAKLTVFGIETTAGVLCLTGHAASNFGCAAQDPQSQR